MTELLNGSEGVDGVGENPTPTTPEADGGRQSQAQEEVTRVSKDEKINLDDHPTFVEAKRKYDSTISKTQKELEQLRQERQQQQQQMTWMEQQLEQLQTKDLDEPGKLAFELQKRDRQLQAMQNMLNQQRVMTVKNQALQNIQQQARDIGVDSTLDELMEFEGADDAWRYLVEKAMKSSATRQQQQQQKREANAVDLGGGSSVSTGGDLQEKYNKAVKAFDANAMLKVLDQAAREGVELSL